MTARPWCYERAPTPHNLYLHVSSCSDAPAHPVVAIDERDLEQKARDRITRRAAFNQIIIRQLDQETGVATGDASTCNRSSVPICIAVRSASATIVSVGFAVPTVGNRPPPARYRFG